MSQKLVQEKFIVNYKNEAHDITEFVMKHPGGINTLQGLNMKSIDEKFKRVDHSEAAEYLLNDYKLKKVEDEINNNNFDESLEHLVNWNSAMLIQIARLGNRYVDWVNKPVDRELRLFENPFIESLTKTAWYLPLIVWLPFIAYLIITESNVNSNLETVVSLFAGVGFWTFLEYLLHRFVFHLDVNAHPTWATFHFLLHGLHHKVPFDDNRLVFPPLPAILITITIYQPLKALVSLYDDDLVNMRLVLAGALMGYLSYDMIHYYIHHGSPSNSYFYRIKRTHYSHHFVNHKKGFGISSPIWDFIFGTAIRLKKASI